MRQRGIVLRPGAVGSSGVVLLMLLSGCGAAGSGGSADRLGTPVATVPTVTALAPSSGSGADSIAPTEGAEGAIGREVLSAYQAWWAGQTAAFARSDSDGTQLEISSSGQALSETLASLHQLHEAKLVMVGAPRNSPTVKSLDLRAVPPTAVISDCLDVSDWHQADAVSGALRDPQKRLSRYPATARLSKVDNHWLIVNFNREVDHTC